MDADFKKRETDYTTGMNTDSEFLLYAKAKKYLFSFQLKYLIINMYLVRSIIMQHNYISK